MLYSLEATAGGLHKTLKHVVLLEHPANIGFKARHFSSP